MNLLEESRELAYELVDLLSQTLLPLFTVKEMAGQFDELQGLHPDILGEKNYINDNGRTFRNVTEIWTEPGVLELYHRAAESILEQAGEFDVKCSITVTACGYSMFELSSFHNLSRRYFNRPYQSNRP